MKIRRYINDLQVDNLMNYSIMFVVKLCIQQTITLLNEVSQIV